MKWMAGRVHALKRSMEKIWSGYSKDDNSGRGYFKSVKPLPGYRLEITMETSAVIHFDFSSKLAYERFKDLRDEEMFNSVTTDGYHLIFVKEGFIPVKITAEEFMYLVLAGRTRNIYDCFGYGFLKSS